MQPMGKIKTEKPAILSVLLKSYKKSLAAQMTTKAGKVFLMD